MSSDPEQIAPDHAAHDPSAYNHAVYDHSDYQTEDPADITLLRQPRTGYDLTLRVVPLADVVPHEHFHGQRVAELTERLVAEGRLINPPIVAQQGGKYVVLDGATRLTALRQLGYRYLIVQLVDLKRQQVQLTSWNHVVFGGRGGTLLDALRTVAGVQLTPVAEGIALEQPLANGALAYLVSRDEGAFALEMQPSALSLANFEWLRLLNKVVQTYGEWGDVERTLSRNVGQLASQFPGMEALVIFPRFTPQTVLEVAALGRTVPAGITRFVIPGRILRLNAPLEKLAGDEPLAAKQAWLDGFIGAKLLERQVRFYEEPVVLLDE